MITSALYVGRVGHTRLRPRRHTLGYRSFMLLIDLEEAEALAGRLRWFSLDRFNLFGFRARDHGDGSSTPLRAQIAAHLEAAGLGASLGAVRLLCLPRVLGYVFNPISLYFCHSAAGELIAILYEVSSTFGERHSYLAAVDGPERARSSDGGQAAARLAFHAHGACVRIPRPAAGGDDPRGGGCAR